MYILYLNTVNRLGQKLGVHVDMQKGLLGDTGGLRRLKDLFGKEFDICII